MFCLSISKCLHLSFSEHSWGHTHSSHTRPFCFPFGHPHCSLSFSPLKSPMLVLGHPNEINCRNFLTHPAQVLLLRGLQCSQVSERHQNTLWAFLCPFLVLRLTHTLEVALISRLDNQHIYLTQFDELIQTISAYLWPNLSNELWHLNPFTFLTSTNTLRQTLFFTEQATVPVTTTKGTLHHPLSLALAASHHGKILFSMRHLFSLTMR